MFMNCLHPTNTALFEETKGWSDFALTLFNQIIYLENNNFYQNIYITINHMEGGQIGIKDNLV